MEQAQTPLSVLLADDHPLICQGITRMLKRDGRMQVVGEVQNGQRAVVLYDALRPDITVMDLQMPVMDGVVAIQSILAINPAACIVVLTTFKGDTQTERALRAGAKAYLLKSVIHSQLVETLLQSYRGGRRLAAAQVRREALSPRELGVLECVALGQSNPEIARQLDISLETVKQHMKNILGKLRVSDRTVAVRHAIANGLINP